MPTRSEIATALVGICDVLLDVNVVVADTEMQTKLKAIKNYADTLFSGFDCSKIRQALVDRPQLLQALRTEDIQAACAFLDNNGNGGGQQLQYALGCVAQVHPHIQHDHEVVEALWDEVHLICELAD